MNEFHTHAHVMVRLYSKVACRALIAVRPAGTSSVAEWDVVTCEGIVTGAGHKRSTGLKIHGSGRVRDFAYLERILKDVCMSHVECTGGLEDWVITSAVDDQGLGARDKVSLAGTGEDWEGSGMAAFAEMAHKARFFLKKKYYYEV